jgi:hypothetical protein
MKGHMQIEKDPFVNTITIFSPDGRVLLQIDMETGEVIGSIEDASEAGKVFVESIRVHINGYKLLSKYEENS